MSREQVVLRFLEVIHSHFLLCGLIDQYDSKRHVRNARTENFHVFYAH